MNKKIIFACLVSSLMILGGCAKHTSTATSTETATATSETTTSESTSASTSSEDPAEAAYKITEEQFVDFVTHCYDNVTLDVDDRWNDYTYSVIFDGLTEKRDWGSQGAQYLRFDSKGVLTLADIYTSSYFSQISDYDPFDYTDTDFTKVGDTERAYYFNNMTEFGAAGDFDLDEIAHSTEKYQARMREFFHSFTYDAKLHAYTGTVETTRHGLVCEDSVQLFFNEQKLVKSLLVPNAPSGLDESVTVLYHDYGTSHVETSTEIDNYLQYFTYRFYDDDQLTLLDTEYVAYLRSASYKGSFDRAPEDDGGAYRLDSWHLPNNSAVAGDDYFTNVTANHDFIATWKAYGNADLYSFDTATKTLSFKGITNIGEMKLPATWTDGTNTYNVEIVDFTKLPSSVKKVNIPSHVVSLPTADGLVLSNREITLDSANTNFTLKDGVLSGDEGTKIYAVNADNGMTSFTVPSDVTTIAPNAFNGNKTLKTVDLSGGHLATISYGALQGCHLLESVKFPAGLTTLAGNAFRDCYALTGADLTNCVGLGTIGASAFSGCHSLASVKLPLVLSGIGAHAFEYCRALKEIALPSTVTSLGDYAFIDDGNLKKVTLPNVSTILSGANIFDGCYSLTDCIIPDTVTTIGSACFRYTYSYVYDIPASVTTLNSSVFYASKGPAKLTLGKNLTGLGQYAFAYNKGLQEVHLEDSGVTVLQDYCFEECHALKTVTVSTALTSIGTSCFLDDDALTSFELPAACNNIGAAAFFGCTSLKLTSLSTVYTTDEEGHFIYSSDHSTLLAAVGLPSIYVAPATLANIGPSVFKNNDNFTTLDLSGITGTLTIAASAFTSCTSLTKVIWPTSSTAQVILSNACFAETGLQTLTIPANVTAASGANYLFNSCENLTSVDMSASTWTTLPYSCFGRCPALTDVKLPKGLTSLSNGEFYNCTSLETIVIPASVTAIAGANNKRSAFDGCTALKAFYLEATEVPSTFETGWNITVHGGMETVECLLYSETEPESYAGKQRYWHYVGTTPTIWVAKD